MTFTLLLLVIGMELTGILIGLLIGYRLGKADGIAEHDEWARARRLSYARD